jgi:hypothetical protein
VWKLDRWERSVADLVATLRRNTVSMPFNASRIKRIHVGGIARHGTGATFSRRIGFFSCNQSVHWNAAPCDLLDHVGPDRSRASNQEY